MWIKTGETKVGVELIRDPNRVVPSSGPRLRFFGWKDVNLPQREGFKQCSLWSAEIEGSLVAPCAQEIFVSFLISILDIILLL
jgi:hypothetical protein